MKSMHEENRTGERKSRVPNHPDMNREMERFEAEEREKLGLPVEKREQWIEPMPNRFTKAQVPHTTILFGGFTVAHDLFIQSSLAGLGFTVQAMDCPDNNSLRLGKEFGNRGQCNPTYFTVGNLVKYLKYLHEEKGLSKEEINEKYLFLTVTGCGPCRFTMYLTEYRKALRDAGFNNFRVLIASQSFSGDADAGEGSGLEITLNSYLKIVKAIFVGDALNALMYRLRPYEVDPGATDTAIERCREILMAAMAGNKSVLRAMWEAHKVLASVKVDRTRVKPKVAIIGEFWAMTTEGDGNYHLQRFLEQEGAEVDIQLMVGWLLFLVWESRYDTRQRLLLRGADGDGRGLAGINGRKRLFLGWLLDRVTRLVFKGFSRTIGLRGYKLADMDELAELSNQYYDNEQRAGEGHLEVAKLMANVIKNKANMTISVKPFGCMPSNGVSDGVQSIITEIYPQAIFLPIETTGDGAVNVYSRIHMQLFKAKKAARKEFDEALEKHGITEVELKSYVEEHPKYSHPLHYSPHRAGCTAADLVHEIGPRVGRWARRTRRATLQSA